MERMSTRSTLKQTLPSDKKSDRSKTTTKWKYLPQLAQQKKKCVKESNYTCEEPDCQMEFRHKYNFERHKLVHSEKRKFHCRKCNVSFKERRGLLKHEKTAAHENGDPIKIHLPPFICKDPGCGLEFSNRNTLIEHNKIAHSDTTCTKCEVTLSDHKSYLTHLKSAIHIEGEPLKKYLPPFICEDPKCGKEFPNRKGVRDHMKFANSGETFYCEKCNKSCMDKRALDRHFRSLTHRRGFKKQPKSSREFKCSFNECAWSFSTEGRLERHMEIHGKPKAKKTKEDRLME